MAYLSTLSAETSLRTALVALYLPGPVRPAHLARSQWPSVVSALRRALPSCGSLPAALKAERFSAEAFILEDERLLAWACRQLDRGHVLTAVDRAYPSRWSALQGKVAPPALWASGEMPAGPFLGVVGARAASPAALTFVEELCAEACRLGFAGVSGGARGCDSAAREGFLASGGAFVEIWPCGLGVRRPATGVVGLSARSRREGFSTPAAMERNALIYASGPTVVVSPRFMQGGAWLGAKEALRRRLGRVLVWQDGSRAARALAALGATPIEFADGLEEALGAPRAQERLALGTQ